MATDSQLATTTRSRLRTVAILLSLLCTVSLQAQKSGGGGKGGGSSSSGNDDSDDTSLPVCPQIVGSHPLLEKLTLELHLTCQQEVKLLPLMHDEEAAIRPLLVYAAFTPEERQAMLLQVELAARAQVRPVASVPVPSFSKWRAESRTSRQTGTGLDGVFSAQRGHPYSVLRPS